MVAVDPAGTDHPRAGQVMLLYPDPRVSDQPENLTTCFSAPIDKCDWEFLFAKARADDINGMPFIIFEGDDLYFMRSTGEDGYDSLAVILQDYYGDRDACLESAAWLRVKYEFNGMIYIVREATTADAWQSYATITANNIPEEFVAMVDLDRELSSQDE